MYNTALQPYLRNLQKYPLLSHEDEVSLIKAFKNGSDQAAEKLVTCNLRFVVSIAKRYQNLGLPLDDLINEGNIGLLSAIEQFDETRGVKFSSYAGWLIKRHIFQALADKAKIVRIPVKRVLALLKQQRKLKQLLKQLRDHDADSDTLRHVEKRIEAVKQKLNASYPYLSLDAPLISGNETHTFLDFIEEDEERQPDQLVFEKMSRDYVYQALTELTEREREIIELYYGLYHQESKTLKEIGDMYGVTRERIRQIKEHALEKLRQAVHGRN